MKNPLEKLFLIYIFFISLSYNLKWFYISGSFAYADILLPILILIMVFRQKYKVLPFQILLFLLFLLTAFSTYFSLFNYATPSSMGYLLRALYFLVLFTLISSFEIEREKVIKALAYGLTFSLVIAWYIWSTSPRFFAFSNVPMLHVLDSNLNAYVNRNETGLTASILGLISFYALIYKRIFSNSTALIIFLFALSSSFLSFSRGSWVITILGISIILFLRLRIKSILFISFLIFPLVLLVPIEGIGIFDLIFLRLESVASNFYRYQYLIDAIDIGFTNFFLGVGPGNYREYAIQNDYLVTIDPHNTYLQYFAELGIFGLIFCFLIYFFLVFKSLKEINYDNLYVILLTIFICLAVDGLISGLSLSMKLIYIFAGIAFNDKSSDAFKENKNEG